MSDRSSDFAALVSGDEFGTSVALDGSRLVVGAPLDNGRSGTDTGAVYIFKRTGTTWALVQEITDNNTDFSHLSSSDEFGTSVALDGSRLVVGAPFDDGQSGTDTGAVYVFSQNLAQDLWF